MELDVVMVANITLEIIRIIIQYVVLAAPMMYLNQYYIKVFESMRCLPQNGYLIFKIISVFMLLVITKFIIIIIVIVNRATFTIDDAKQLLYSELIL